MEVPTSPTSRVQKNWQLPTQGSLGLKPAQTGLGAFSEPQQRNRVFSYGGRGCG